MSLANDLLEQAVPWRQWTRADRARQTSDGLSRPPTMLCSICIVDASARRLAPKRHHSLRAQIARAYTHQEMRVVCRSISTKSLPEAMLELQPQGFSEDLRVVAQAIVSLQGSRYKADYDTKERFSRSEVDDLIAQAEDAFTIFRRIRLADETTVFLVALLLARRWTR